MTKITSSSRALNRFEVKELVKVAHPDSDQDFLLVAKEDADDYDAWEEPKQSAAKETKSEDSKSSKSESKSEKKTPSKTPKKSLADLKPGVSSVLPDNDDDDDKDDKD